MTSKPKLTYWQCHGCNKKSVMQDGKCGHCDKPKIGTEKVSLYVE